MIIESYEDVIILSGALRSNFWDTIHTAISLTLKRHPSGVIIDCSGLTEATPQGVETFQDAMSFIGSHDARIIVAAVPPNVMEILKTVPDVRSQLPIASSVEEARHSLDLLIQEASVKPRKRAVVENATKLLVCLYTGTSIREDNAAMSVASRIAEAAPTEVHLVCLLLVPRNLPLQSPMHEQEDSAAAAVERAKKFFQARDVVHHARVERTRDVASGLVEALAETDAPEIVLPLIHDPLRKEENLRMIESVLTKIDRLVIFVRG